MLQFPTNVYPQNVAFDPTVVDENNRLKFVFNGDILTTAHFKVYNYMTGELVATSFYATPEGEPWHYNGEEVFFVNGTLGHDLSIGNDYVIQMMLTQCDADGYTICDMPVVRGKVQSGSSTHQFTIEDKINNIYEWETSGGLNVPTYTHDYLAAAMVIQINNDMELIESYNRDTGEIITLGDFDVAPQAGDSYIIYSNYIVTPQYYFMCRKTPTLTVDSEMKHPLSQNTDIVLATSGEYSQIAGNRHRTSMIKNYDFKLYWYNDDISADSNKWILLKESPKIYSQNIYWCFLGSLVGIDNANGTISDVSDTYYKIECNLTIQEGMTVTSNDIVHIAANVTDAFENPTLTAEIVDNLMPDYIKGENRKKHQSVLLTYTATDRPLYTDFEVWVYRRNLETNEIVFLGVGLEYGASVTLYDYLVPNKGSFEYVCVPREADTGNPYISGIAKATINTDMTGYTITALIPNDYVKVGDVDESYYGRYRYDIGDCWKFVGEVQDTTITQNTSRVTHVGAGKYTSQSMTDINYSSGTLSAMIGAVDCTDKKYKDTIDMVKAWREFITKNSVFMLKSQKGDVLIVNISDSPSTTYSEMENGIPTTFTFNWNECISVNDVIISQT